MDPVSFYQAQLTGQTEQLLKTKKKLTLLATARGLSFLLAAYMVYLGVQGSGYWFFGAVLVFAGFLVLISKHTDVRYHRDYLKALITINKTEIEVLCGAWNHLPNGNEYHEPDHVYAQDIDLFGDNSLFQYVNRTTLSDGKHVLAQWFKANETSAITERQQAIAELADLATWRQEYIASGRLIKTEVDTKTTLGWLANYTPFLPGLMKWFPKAFSLGSVVMLSTYFMGWVPGGILTFWFFIGLGITGIYVKRVSRLSAHTGKIAQVFQQYHRLMALVERQGFESTLLQKTKARLEGEAGTTTKALKQFGRYLSALDQRNNVIIGLFTNGFFLKDLWEVGRIESWIAQNGKHVKDWFVVLAHFDAYNSLANYAFNHPDHTYPEIRKDGPVLEAVAAVHPLLGPDAVTNGFTMQANRFFVVTGANMAGKSTYLRTVSLLIVMGNMGLPVRAKRFMYSPIKLITSMRTSDSLADSESYFFSELKRLKFIVDALETESYFVILDEILKGTNSTDKAIGSKKFVERLVKAGATGIVATHDLSLCDIANEYAEVENHFFDAQIVNGELYFDYIMKSGICQNMNASFLLNKMGIVD
ncbi:MutS-related protein [Sediminicola luteus]|uniref:DNA mismatch repair protein MutS n=1 Tax=Sediminicola luteus TaxID=319238 RepID=A0A2A4GE82_9FLAO|nr:DNA mismatch repair protein MutS [Sediminicola luteus]PCE66105.1 DNA mismatch repair protein MutS [Sediminicola luteus]